MALSPRLDFSRWRRRSLFLDSDFKEKSTDTIKMQMTRLLEAKFSSFETSEKDEQIRKRLRKHCHILKKRISQMNFLCGKILGKSILPHSYKYGLADILTTIIY